MNAIGITRNPKAGKIEIKMTPVAVVANAVLFREESSLGSFLIDSLIDCPMANRADTLKNFKKFMYSFLLQRIGKSGVSGAASLKKP
jgi:hypothetical protein